MERIFFQIITITDNSYSIQKSCSNHVRICTLIPQSQTIYPFLSQTLQDRNHSCPALYGKELISLSLLFPALSGKEWFQCGNNKKEYQSWQKNSGKYTILLGGTSGSAVLCPQYRPQKLYAFLCSFVKIIILFLIITVIPHSH